MIDKKLLDILCDPVTKVPVGLLDRTRLGKLNQAIDAGVVQYVDGDPVEEALEAALITEDDKVIYPVQDGIPVMLEDRGIGTTQLNDF